MTEESLKPLEDEKEFTAYHGTDTKNVTNIQKSNFNKSEELDEWLGYGVYFFIEGISCPINNAKEWAINQGWKRRVDSYCYYSVLSVQVKATNVLDTNIKEHLVEVNKVRSLLIEIEKNNWARDRNFSEDNRVMWNLIADFMDLEIIIHNLYIQTKTERILKIKSNIPNATVMCVKNVANIQLNSLKVIDKGRVRL